MNGSITGGSLDDRFYLIEIEGDFDAALRDEAIAVTEAALGKEPGALLVDVKRCTFLDSTAIAAVLGARQRALAAGIAFALVGHNPTVDRTIELTGLAKDLPILTDRHEAIAELSGAERPSSS
jgi:anti-sigma B factor antagonist